MRKRFIGVLVGAVLAALLIVGCATGARQDMRPGTYAVTVPAMMGPLSMEVTVSPRAITGIRVISHSETPGLAEWPIELIPAQIIANQSLNVDVVTGVTLTSRAIVFGVEQALNQAGANIEGFRRTVRAPRVRNRNLRADVIIVGGGGAGLSAAVSALESGASVILVEKSGFLGGNSIVAGGIINTSFREWQDHAPAEEGLNTMIINAIAETPVNEMHRSLIERVRVQFQEFLASDRTLFDSPAWHALQTFNGGDQIADIRLIELLTYNSQAAVEWLMGMGMQFTPYITQVPGSMYPRGLVPVLPNGTGIIQALTDTLAGNRNYTYFMETRATGLISEGGRVVGVNAVGRHGNRLTLRANRGVILATGGFAANVELRQQYAEGPFWPYLGPTLNTTNVATVTGDGHFFARDAGADLVGMDQIQLLHVTNPWTGHTGCMAGSTLNVANSVFVNQEGHRFVREDGRRDEISLAIMAQTGGVAHVIISSDGMPDPDLDLTLDKRSFSYMLEHNLAGFVRADTLEELAGVLGVNPANLAAAIAEYNSHVDSQVHDRFGRALLLTRFETGPWFSQPRAPATHYTMGGVRIDEYTRALRADGSVIPGLYIAGELIGDIHGTNRLGGNAITEFLVFGRIAGQSAALGR